MLASLLLQSDAWIYGVAMIYCRVQAILIAIPAFGDRALSVRVRVLLAVALVPLFSFNIDYLPLSLQGMAVAMIGELVIGLIIGLMVRVLVYALDIAASAIATTASLSQLVGVANEFSPHPIGNLLHLAGLALLMSLGFPLLVCDLIRESLLIKPVGEWPDIEGLMQPVVGLISRGFFLAMLMASPFILGGFLFQALSGVISKVMPALPIVFVGAPAAILLALIALAILTPAILSVWADAIMSFILPDL